MKLDDINIAIPLSFVAKIIPFLISLRYPRCCHVGSTSWGEAKMNPAVVASSDCKADEVNPFF